MKSFHEVSQKNCLPIGPLKINNKTYVGVTPLSDARSEGGGGWSHVKLIQK